MLSTDFKKVSISLCGGGHPASYAKGLYTSYCSRLLAALNSEAVFKRQFCCAGEEEANFDKVELKARFEAELGAVSIDC